ncbi:MAG: flagellin [Ruegeria sp.]|nr:flagellin [Ruegeria sp.]
MRLQTRSVELRNQIDTLSYELVSGKVQDVSRRLDGDYSHLLDLDRSLSRLDAFKVSTAEARLFTDATQLSLTTVNDSVDEVAASLLSFGTSNQAVSHENASAQARNELDTIMSALNKRAGGRSLYSGTATDISPLASAGTLLSALEVELSGYTSVGDIRQAAEDWFNDPDGFDAIVYRGSDTALAPMQISENESVQTPITATDPALKDAMRHIAVAALLSDDALNLPRDQRTELFKQLGGDLANTQNQLVNLRAQVGSAQARIEKAATRNSAAKNSLELSRNELIAANPEETATKLQNLQVQLESLYSVTVRNSNLSLVNFLR